MRINPCTSCGQHVNINSDHGTECPKRQVSRIPDNHLRKPCPDGPSYRTQGQTVEQWVPGTGWVDITPGVVEWGTDYWGIIETEPNEQHARGLSALTGAAVYQRSAGGDWVKAEPRG